MDALPVETEYLLKVTNKTVIYDISIYKMWTFLFLVKEIINFY